MNFEDLLTSKQGFALTTATPLQRAIARVVDGKPTGLPPAAIIKHFGVEPTERPTVTVLVCGVRSGKSLIAGAAAVYSALTANLSKLPLHERARVPIIAPTVQNAADTFRLLTGAVQASKALKTLIVGTPKNDELTIRRADGRLVDIVVVAAHRGAVTLRGTWLAGFIMEEVSNFGADSQGYVVSGEELLVAAETRLVPNAVGMIISSPLGPTGLLHDLWKKHWGSPGDYVVVHAPTLSMNSVTMSAEAVERIRKRDPDRASREYDAAWADSDSALIPAAHIDACTRAGPATIPWQEGYSYVAAVDPAFRGNAWSLVVATQCAEKPHQRVVMVREWIGSKVQPLDPDAVLREIAELLRGYKLDRCATDQFAADALISIARRHNLYLWTIAATAGENIQLFESLAVKFADGEVEIPLDITLRNDILGVRKRVANKVSIILQRTPDGRHSDHAPALARVLSMGNIEPKPVLPAKGTPEWIKYVAESEKEKARQSAMRRGAQEGKAFHKSAKSKDFNNLRKLLK